MTRTANLINTPSKIAQVLPGRSKIGWGWTKRKGESTMKTLSTVFVLCFIAEASPAASTPDHALQGFLLTGYTRWLADHNVNRNQLLWESIAGGVIGALPDIIGQTGYLRPGYWPNYNWSHSWRNPLVVFPQYSLHLWVDSKFHRFEGDTWWPRLWKTCVLMWIGEAVLTYIFIKFILPERN